MLFFCFTELNSEHVVHENYKFMASFRRENVHFCTASLISNKHALTAAFCFKDFLTEIDIPDFDLYTLVAGRHDINGKSAVFQIEHVIRHHRFSFLNTVSIYGIGVIKVMYKHIFNKQFAL